MMETSLPVSAYDSVAATILGGAIAGLVGFGTARYESYLKRREAHFREHKENFEIVQEALESLRAEVFPLTAKGVDDLRLPRWKEPPFKRQLERWSIFRYERVEPIGDTGQFSVTAVDEVLYSDIAKHFAQDAELLADLAKLVRKEGVELDTLTWDVSHAIYDAMGSSDLSVLKWTFQEGKRTSLRDMVTIDSSEAQSYAGVLFLMLTDEDPGNWPNTYAQLKEYELIPDLKAFADTMREKFGPKIVKMLELRTELLRKIDACISTTEQIRHRTRMKGRCQYL